MHPLAVETDFKTEDKAEPTAFINHLIKFRSNKICVKRTKTNMR